MKKRRTTYREAKILRIDGIFSGYNQRPVIKNLSLRVHPGEVLAVIGQNGSGKSTLLKTIMGFLPAQQGDIHFNDKRITNLPPYRLKKLGIGYFMQGGAVFPHLSVGENLEIGGAGLTKTALDTKITEMTEMLPFLTNERLTEQASSLSGGERHQLALGMILMQEPGLLLLDEPSAGLSPANVDEMYHLLSTIRQNSPISILLIEQKVTEAVKFSDRVSLLKNGTIARTEPSTQLTTITDLGTFFFGELTKNALE